MTPAIGVIYAMWHNCIRDLCGIQKPAGERKRSEPIHRRKAFIAIGERLHWRLLTLWPVPSAAWYDVAQGLGPGAPSRKTGTRLVWLRAPFSSVAGILAPHFFTKLGDRRLWRLHALVMHRGRIR